jgi:hypothetical protein
MALVSLSPNQARSVTDFKPTFPMGTYVSQPLATKCNTLEEIRLFLTKCRYVSGQEQFNRTDYWMPPEQFEARKKGDCDDFVLWAWPQLIAIGYDARFVSGLAGRYGSVHAWVHFTDNARHFLWNQRRHGSAQSYLVFQRFGIILGSQ